MPNFYSRFSGTLGLEIEGNDRFRHTSQVLRFEGDVYLVILINVQRLLVLKSYHQSYIVFGAVGEIDTLGFRR